MIRFMTFTKLRLSYWKANLPQVHRTSSCTIYTQSGSSASLPLRSNWESAKEAKIALFDQALFATLACVSKQYAAIEL